MDFLPLHKCFSSTLSAASPSVHRVKHCNTVQRLKRLLLVLQMIVFVELIIFGHVTSGLRALVQDLSAVLKVIHYLLAVDLEH